MDTHLLGLYLAKMWTRNSWLSPLPCLPPFFTSDLQHLFTYPGKVFFVVFSKHNAVHSFYNLLAINTFLWTEGGVHGNSVAIWWVLFSQLCPRVTLPPPPPISCTPDPPASPSSSAPRPSPSTFPLSPSFSEENKWTISSTPFTLR